MTQDVKVTSRGWRAVVAAVLATIIVFILPPFIILYPTWAFIISPLVRTTVVMPNVVPWIETGYPVAQTEDWRMAICYAHHIVYRFSDSEDISTLYSALSLDITQDPLSAVAQSIPEQEEISKAIQEKIIDSYLYLARGSLGEGNDEQNRLVMLNVIYNVLKVETMRDKYDAHFVGPLTKDLGSSSEKRLGILERLCA